MDPLFVAPTVTIPARELRMLVARASGPGGQNVNKVSSKVELLFDFQNTRSLDGWTRGRLATLARNRIDSDGQLHIVSQASRDQKANLDDAREKLAELIREAMVRPKVRKATRPSRGAKERRLSDKRHTSQRKSDRRRDND